MIGASILFTGCSWVKEKLQGAVDDINTGISDSAKEIGKELNGTSETTKTETTTETTTETKTETPAVETPAK